jgi:LacI family transcriptional regulator
VAASRALITNNYGAMIEATRHLINHGHRRIAHLGNELATATTRGRHIGFTQAMAEAGLAESSPHVDGLSSEQASCAAVHGLMHLDNRPLPCSPRTIW